MPRCEERDFCSLKFIYKTLQYAIDYENSNKYTQNQKISVEK